MANILRQTIGSELSVTFGSSVANNGYSASGDKLTIDNGTNKALLADFAFTPTFAAAPVVGTVQLFAVDYSLDGATAGPAPSSTMLPRLVGSFSPQPQSSNAATSWLMRLNAVAITGKSDYYVRNATTGQTINAGAVLKAQCWTPGTP